MHYHDEIRELEVKPRNDEKPVVDESKPANQLIESISSDTFNTKAYYDEYWQRIMDLILTKYKGKILQLGGGSDAAAQRKHRARLHRRKGARSRVLPAQAPRELSAYSRLFCGGTCQSRAAQS
jgi:hypothetical protein